MEDTVLAIWDEICRRHSGKGLDQNRLQMVSPDSVVRGLFPILKEIGEREHSTPASLDVEDLLVAEAYWRTSCASCMIVPLDILRPVARDTVRELAKFALVSVQIMTQSDLDYGPVPAGLSGRPLGFASLALEILQQKTPQRLLPQLQRRLH